MLRKITVEELQKSLQNLANQKGRAGFARAKALFMDGVMVTDEAGNPVDPNELDITIAYADMAEEPAVEQDGMYIKPQDEDEDMTKSIESTVRSVIREEISFGLLVSKKDGGRRKRFCCTRRRMSATTRSPSHETK